MATCIYVALVLRLELKLWENPYWHLQVHGLTSISYLFGCLQKIQDYVMKEDFEDLENLLVFF
jgi:hypothetical protein